MKRPSIFDLCGAGLQPCVLRRPKGLRHYSHTETALMPFHMKSHAPQAAAEISIRRPPGIREFLNRPQVPTGCFNRGELYSMGRLVVANDAQMIG